MYEGKTRCISENIEKRKTADFDEIPPEIWKTRKFYDTLLRLCNAVYKQNAIGKLTEGCIHLIPNKGDLGITKNSRGITITTITTKIYNVLFLIRSRPEVEKVPRQKSEWFFLNR